MNQTSRHARWLIAPALALAYQGAVSAAAADIPGPEQVPPIARVTAHATASPGPDDGSGPAAATTVESLGFVIEPSGLLLTTYRTLLEPGGGKLVHDIRVELPAPDGEFAARIVAVEPTLNIAILNIDPPEPLRSSTIAEREDIAEGQTVFAPRGWGDDGGATEFVSGTLAKLNSMECYQESMTATMYQADIEIPDLAFGGPVFGPGGEVVAVHTGYQPSLDDVHLEGEEEDRLQHLLPIHLPFNIYDSLKFRKSMKSPWTGFSIRPLTDEEKAVFPTADRFLGGVGIDYVWENSPAEKLGVREDDILVRFSYYPILSEADFQKWLYRHGVGHAVKMRFIRGLENRFTVDYVIEERPGWAVPR